MRTNPDDHTMIPTHFGGYQLYLGDDGTPQPLGEGAYGQTYRACRVRTVNTVEIRDDFAIKILHSRLMSDPRRQQHFLSEIIAQRKLQHANLVRYMDCGEEHGRVFLVMDLCQGGSLADLCRQIGPIDEDSIMRIGLQMCGGLEAAHARDYLHRDLKPSNILLSEPLPDDADAAWLHGQLAEGKLRFKLADFGLADRLLGGNKTGNRRTFAGSPMFASPEQVRESSLDRRSDLYSLGITLWFLALGKGPFLDAQGRELRHSKAAMKRHTSSDAHREHFSDLFSAEFGEVMERLVAKKPGDRFSAAEEAADALWTILRNRPKDAPPGTHSTGKQAIKAEEAVPLPVGWGQGEVTDTFEIVGQVRRRSPGTLYEARRKGNDRLQHLTLWSAANPRDSGGEHAIYHYLDRVAALTRDEKAPPGLTTMDDILRTASDWAVAEEMKPGITMAQLLQSHGRQLGLENTIRLLSPLADVCDYLTVNGISHLHLSVDDVAVTPLGAEGPPPDTDFSWAARPVKEWPAWQPEVSAMILPESLHAEADPVQRTIGSTVSASVAFRESGITIEQGFSRLLYRMVEGSEVSTAADWDPYAYVDTARLNARSNRLLRNQIGSETADDMPMVKLLQEVCRNEGLLRLERELASGSLSTSGISSSQSATVTGIGTGIGTATGTGTGTAAAASAVPASMMGSGTTTSAHTSASTLSATTTQPLPPPLIHTHAGDTSGANANGKSPNWGMRIGLAAAAFGVLVALMALLLVATVLRKPTVTHHSQSSTTEIRTGIEQPPSSPAPSAKPAIPRPESPPPAPPSPTPDPKPNPNPNPGPGPTPPAQPVPTPATPPVTTPVSTLGTVTITSDPGGAMVTRGNQQLGTTPLRMDRVRAGEVIYSLALNGYTSAQVRGFVKDGEALALHGKLAAQPGTVIITSEPANAEVFDENNRYLGNTPLTRRRMTPGRVTFSVMAEGYEPAAVSGSVNPGGTITLSAVLRKKPPANILPTQFAGNYTQNGKSTQMSLSLNHTGGGAFGGSIVEQYAGFGTTGADGNMHATLRGASPPLADGSLRVEFLKTYQHFSQDPVMYEGTYLPSTGVFSGQWYFPNDRSINGTFYFKAR